MPLSEKVQINPLKIKVIDVTIAGTTSMIQNRFSQKARMQILEKQMRTAKTGKKPVRDPNNEFEQGLHVMEEGKFTYTNKENPGLGEVKFTGKVGFPAFGVKAAIVAAARNVDDLPMTLLRGALFLKGDENDLIEVKYKKLIMREHTVVIGRGTTDLRYRPELRDWTMKLQIEFNSDVLTVSEVINLLSIAGFSVGLAEMRPGKTGGNYGKFEVKEQ